MLCVSCKEKQAIKGGLCADCLAEEIERGITLAKTNGQDDSTPEEIENGEGYNPDPVLFEPFYPDPNFREHVKMVIEGRKGTEGSIGDGDFLREMHLSAKQILEDENHPSFSLGDPPLDEKEIGYVARGARSLALALYRERTGIMKAVPNIPNWEEACALAPPLFVDGDEEEPIAA